VTAGQNPAAVAPGANDTVTIGAAANGATQVLIGNGNAYGLTLEGETLLDGVFNVVGTGASGGLTVAQYASVVLYTGSSLAVSGDATFGPYYSGVTLNGGTMTVGGTVYGAFYYGGYPYSQNVIENGGSLTAGALVGYGSSFSVGAGSALTVKGNVSDSTAGYGSAYYVSGAGARFTVGGAFVSTDDSVSASGGATVQLAALTEDAHGNGAYLDVYDLNSSIEIGTAGGAAAGTITIDAGKTVTEAGSFSAPTIADNGALAVASNQTLTLSGALTGAGTASIGAGSTLNCAANVAASPTLDFAGTGGTLDLSNPLGYQGADIAGFAATDNVDLAGAWSLLSFNENSAGTLGTLTLTNGTNQAALEFAGSFTQSSFTINSGTTTIIGHS
jgi:hypothetical protein